MAECKTCIHYDDCLEAFRDAQSLGLYDDCTEDEYFSCTDDCTYYADKHRYIEVPVKPGDTVYIINHNKITEWKVCFVGINLLGDVKFHVADEGYHNVHEFWDYNIGVCVFLTEEDAINELKERKSYDNT